MSNTSDFTINKEDHTLGNLLSEALKQAPHVLFTAYKSRRSNQACRLDVVFSPC